jgi:hypothetical protein
MISKKKLIEVALPLDAINVASAREALPYDGLVVARSGVGRLTAEKVKGVPAKADCSGGQ